MTAVERGKIEHDLVLEDDLQLYGMATRSVTVPTGTRFDLYGTAQRVIIDGGACFIYGTVTRDVTFLDGSLVVAGVISGTLDDRPGTAVIESGAIVGS